MKDSHGDRKRHGRDTNPALKLSQDDVDHIREMRSSGQRCTDIAKLFGIRAPYVSELTKGRKSENLVAV